MGKLKPSEDIKPPEATFEAHPPPSVTAFPPNSQPSKFEQEDNGIPKKHDSPKECETTTQPKTVVAVPSTSEPEVLTKEGSPRKHESVVSFPPTFQTEEIKPAGNATRLEQFYSFPPTPQQEIVEEIQNKEIVEIQNGEPVLNQNAMLTPPIGNPWTTGLFDCMTDPKNTLMTALLPCVTFGQIAEVLDAGELTCPVGGLLYIIMTPVLLSRWNMGSKYRKKLRMKYGLVDAPHNDIYSHIFCPFCSLCQEFRELRNRGLDPALGWKGIVAQRVQHEMMITDQQMNNPPPIQSMSM